MERNIHQWRLSLGLLLANVCLFVPVAFAFFAVFANSGFGGGSFNDSGFFLCITSTLGILLAFDIAIGFGAFWLRWLFCIALALLTLVTLVYLPMLFHIICKWDADSIIPVIILIFGLFLCPLATLLIAVGVKIHQDPT